MLDDHWIKIGGGAGIGFIIACLLCFTGGCHSINQKLGLPDDGPLEQAAESIIDGVIEKEIGINPHIDLTP